MKTTLPFGNLLIAATLFLSFLSPLLSKGQANNTNGDNIDLNYVRFNMFMNPDLASTDVNLLKASVTYQFKTTVNSVQKLKFDLMRNGGTGDFNPHTITIDSIHYKGVKYTSATTRSVDTLIITLPATIPTSGTQDSITIHYHGTPFQNSGGRGFKKTTISTVNIISTHSSGFYARQWWPCKHNMTDKMDSVEFFLTAPSAYKTVTNGVLKNGPTPPTDGNGNKTWHWKSTYPIAPYLIAIGVHPYVVHNSPAANISGTMVPIVNYLTTGTNTSTVRDACDAMGPVMEHFSTLFGDYPFKNEKYGHAAYTFSGGMENQTVSFIGTGSLSNRSLLAHELAHQWWGDKITCLKWSNNWVNEGFARYAEILYSEEFESAGADVTKRASYKSPASVKSANETVYRYDVEVVSVADHGGKIFNSSMVYDKAAIVISMLRKLVGDAVFFQTLRNYMNDPLIRYNHAATEDVRRHFEATSGKDLTAFFDDFIYKAGYPTYNVQWAYSAGHSKVAIKLNQTKFTSGTYALSGRYHTVLPIRLRKTTAPVKDTVIIVYDDGVASLNTMLFNVSFPVNLIEVDPYSESYSYDNTITNTPALVATLPTNLLRFNADKKDKAVNITWQSGKEDQFSHYEIEHGTDGISFTKINTTNAKNGAVNQYQFTHQSPLTGNNYYRLKMVSLNGQFTYSDILTVAFGFGDKVKVMPNPAYDIVRITIPSGISTDNIPVRFINMQGQVHQATAMKTGQDVIEINIKNIPAGNYWIELRLNGSKIVERLLIQH